MIWTFICIGLLLISLIANLFTKFVNHMYWKSKENHKKYENLTDYAEFSSVHAFFEVVPLLVGGILSFFVFMIFLCNHAWVNKDIYEAQIKYEALCKRYEIVTSEYEDMSKSDVIKDIAEWNEMVYADNYWNNSIWTNWLYSDEYVASLKYIEYKEDL